MFQKPNWPAQKQVPSVRMVAPAPEEDDYPPPAERSGSEDSESSESYVVTEKLAISTVEDELGGGDLKAIFRHDRKMFPLWERRSLVQGSRVPNV